MRMVRLLIAIGRHSGLPAEFVAVGLCVLTIALPHNAAAESNQLQDTPGGRLHVASDFLYVAASCDGLQILDISNPAGPRWVGAWRHPQNWCARSVYSVGQYAYVVSHFAGLDILDVRNPQAPFSVGCIATGGDTTGVHVVGRYAYLADGKSGLQVVDVSDPAKPVHVGGHPTSFHADTVQVVADVAYVACGPEGLQTFDVKNPLAPVLIGKCCVHPVGCHALQVIGRRAYIASYSSHTLCVLDVSNPSKPAIEGTFRLAGYSQGIYADDRRLYAATFIGTNGLSVVDVRPSAQPKLLGACTIDAWAWDVRVSGDYAYVMDRAYNVRVLDVRDASNPKEVGLFNRHGYVSKLLALKRPFDPSPTLPTGTDPAAENNLSSSHVPIPRGGISNAPPELLNPRRAVGGSFAFTLVGVPNARYVVCASADLITWSPISTNVLPPAGNTEVTDAKAGEFAQRYYRAVMLP